jgi:hypothetical protein
MSGLDHVKSDRAGRRLVARLVTVGLVSAALAMAGFVGSASADSPSDPRAEFHEGNATTCADVGFPNDTILFVNGANNGADANVSGTVSGNGTILNVTNVGGVDIHAIVVKGGNGYNVYSTNVPNMISPLNNGGQIPAISHWFVCYGPPVPPPPPPPGPEAGAAAQPGAAVAVVSVPVFTG